MITYIGAGMYDVHINELKGTFSIETIIELISDFTALVDISESIIEHDECYKKAYEEGFSVGYEAATSLYDIHDKLYKEAYEQGYINGVETIGKSCSTRLFDYKSYCQSRYVDSEEEKKVMLECKLDYIAYEHKYIDGDILKLKDGKVIGQINKLLDENDNSFDSVVWFISDEKEKSLTRQKLKVINSISWHMGIPFYELRSEKNERIYVGEFYLEKKF